MVVSDVVRGLLFRKDFEYGPPGEAELKGFDESVALYDARTS